MSFEVLPGELFKELLLFQKHQLRNCLYVTSIEYIVIYLKH